MSTRNPVVSTQNAQYVGIGIVLALVFWFAEAAIHYFLIERDSFLSHVVAPTAHELWMRLLVAGLLIVLGLYAQQAVQDKRADRAEGQQGEQNRDPGCHQEDKNRRADQRLASADHGNRDRVILVGGRGNEEVQHHGYGEAGENGHGIFQSRESGVDHRVGDAHQLDVEQQGKEEKGNVLLGQAGIAQG